MKHLFGIVEQLFWTLLWVFGLLIIGYFILGYAANSNIPLLSNAASWVTRHSEPQS